MLPGFIEKDICLKNLNTWRVGGKADYFCKPKTVQELKEALTWANKNQLIVTPLGGGSNVLISEKGIRGLVLSTKELNEVHTPYIENDKFYIKAQAGAKKADILKIFLKENLAPALFLAGLPGDLAGGVVMNAGVAESFVPREFCEIVSEIEVMSVLESGKVIEKKVKHEDIEWGYRYSKGWQPGVICSVTLCWPWTPDMTIKQRVKEANQVRLSKQPLKEPSCGSTFRNPTKGKSAGFLIEQAGLKGYFVGGARVSEKHANFIVTNDQAKASDVDQVIQKVKVTIKEKYGVELHSEVIKLGEW